MNEKERAYFEDMLTVSQAVRKFVLDVSFEEFSANSEHQLFIGGAIVELGAGSNQIQSVEKDWTYDPQWRELYGLRERILAGDRFDRVQSYWKAATTLIPSLNEQLKRWQEKHSSDLVFSN